MLNKSGFILSSLIIDFLYFMYHFTLETNLFAVIISIQIVIIGVNFLFLICVYC